MTFEHLQFSDTFLDSLLAKEFSRAEQRQFLKALRLLDTDEQHPSLRLHTCSRHYR